MSSSYILLMVSPLSVRQKHGHIEISFVFPRTLESLKRLNPTALREIQYLKVTIYDLDAGVVKPWKDTGGCCMKWKQSPLHHAGLTQRRCKWLPRKCEIFFTYLSQHVQESHLKLSLVCDVKTHSLARNLTDPARRLPVLNQVAIRFNAPYDADVETTALHVLADDLVNHLIDKTRLSRQPFPPSKSFRFTDLPTEIQIKILEQTELEAPGKVAWNFMIGFNCDRKQDEFHRCKTCQAVRDDNNWDWYERCLGTLIRRCGCWKSPISLFLVSRRMHQLGTEVLHSKNHFAVMPVLRQGDFCYRDRVCFLLPHLQANALRSLRKITFYIPPDLVRIVDPYYFQNLLRRVAECLLDKATLHRLLLVIVFNVTPDSDLFWQIQEQEPGKSGQGKRKEWQRIQGFLEQLRQLRHHGLMDLFVELRVIYNRGPSETVNDYEKEAFLERYIMGEIYNSMERWKRELWEVD